MLAGGLITALGMAGAACGQAARPESEGGPTAGAISHSRDGTAKALLRIARAFKDHYQANKDSAVYGRWRGPLGMRSEAPVQQASTTG